MCQKGTIRTSVALLTLILAGFAKAQLRPNWRKVGPSSAELTLASPATGPVAQVWFSSLGSTFYALTRSGKIFETADSETWVAAPGATVPPAASPVASVRLPEPGSTVVAAPPGGPTLFALGRNLYRSQDGGRSWSNLTGYKSQSIIGSGQRSVAVSPSDPNQIAVANDFGVWRTMDGGSTWDGLNQSLPNLPVRRILSTPGGAHGTRVQVEGWPVVLEMPPGNDLWLTSPSPALQDEEARKKQYSDVLGTRVTAVASSGETVYVGSEDGRVWFSNDGGATLQSSRLPAGVAGPVERIYADPDLPRAALAAVGGSGVHVLRTFTGGDFWDAIDSNLPAVPALSVTAEPDSGAVYVATSKGVFWTMVDLATAGSPPQWNNVSDGLPDAPVYDVRLDPSGVQLYVAVDGYGVYATAAPHRRRSPRIINAADFSGRPAAPGALLSVIGAHVNSARGADLDYPVLGMPSDSESQIQVPYGASGPTVSLALETTAGPLRLGLQVQPVSPAIFVSRDGAPMLFDADSGLQIDGHNPAQSGGRIQIFATGLGKVQPDWPAGVPAPLEGQPHVVTAAVKAYLDGAPLQVTRAALAPGYTGFYLIEAQLPVVANFGSSQLYIAADGQESNRVQVVIEP